MPPLVKRAVNGNPISPEERSDPWVNAALHSLTRHRISHKPAIEKDATKGETEIVCDAVYLVQCIISS